MPEMDYEYSEFMDFIDERTEIMTKKLKDILL